jgi:hypothetical protein
VFKGGTSLSKGYRLIERFSEDVDILITPHEGDSAKTRETRLANISATVAETLNVELIEAREPGRGQHAHRADILAYTRTLPSEVEVPGEARGVLLETGYAGGDWPVEIVTIMPLLNDPLGIVAGDYEDTEPFKVRALKPARTLLEKVSLLHNLASGWTVETSAAERRCGRHYYDVHQLLGHKPTRKALEDRAHFEVMVAETQRLTEKHFRGAHLRPEDGFAAGPAFSSPNDSELHGWLAGSYTDAAVLLPSRAGGSGWPKFNSVLLRIQESAHLL